MSRHAKIRRTSRTAPVRPVVHVVCDDTKAAVAYFVVIARSLRDSVTIKAHCAPRCGATAASVVRLAKTLQTQTKRPTSAATQVFALVDTEAERTESAMTAKTAGAKAGIEVAVSSPCFEVFVLLHLADGPGTHDRCATVHSELKRLWKRAFKCEFDKAKADYSKLESRWRDAIRRSSAAESGATYTEVGRVLESILNLADAQRR